MWKQYSEIPGCFGDTFLGFLLNTTTITLYSMWKFGVETICVALFYAFLIWLPFHAFLARAEKYDKPFVDKCRYAADVIVRAVIIFAALHGSTYFTGGMLYVWLLYMTLVLLSYFMFHDDKSIGIRLGKAVVMPIGLYAVVVLIQVSTIPRVIIVAYFCYELIAGIYRHTSQYIRYRMTVRANIRRACDLTVNSVRAEVDADEIERQCDDHLKKYKDDCRLLAEFEALKADIGAEWTDKNERVLSDLRTSARDHLSFIYFHSPLHSKKAPERLAYIKDNPIPGGVDSPRKPLPPTPAPHRYPYESHAAGSAWLSWRPRDTGKQP